MAPETSTKHPRPVPSARMPLARCAAAVLAVGAAFASHAVGLAPAPVQDEEVTAPPQPDQGLTYSSPVGGYALMALAGAALIGVSLLPSKRGHQD